MQPNLLIYTKMSSDIDSIESFDQLSASDENPLEPKDHLLYQKRNSAYLAMQNVYKSVCESKVFRESFEKRLDFSAPCP